MVVVGKVAADAVEPFGPKVFDCCTGTTSQIQNDIPFSEFRKLVGDDPAAPAAPEVAFSTCRVTELTLCSVENRRVLSFGGRIGPGAL